MFLKPTPRADGKPRIVRCNLTMRQLPPEGMEVAINGENRRYWMKRLQDDSVEETTPQPALPEPEAPKAAGPSDPEPKTTRKK